ncbi:unnamed protein product, partial [Clonostachys solani]
KHAWVVPSLMSSGLVLGTLLAITHHLFYASLDQRPVAYQAQQEWYFRIGIGLAFLVKAFFTASAVLAYNQLVWYTLRSEPVTLAGVDAMFGVISNLFDFTDKELWRRGRGLVAIAIIVWTMPLITVFSPSALRVQTSTHFNETWTKMALPVLEYQTVQKFAQWQAGGSSAYSSPSSRISRLLSATAAQGAILNIASPFPNCSYTVEFYGPSLSCGSPSAGISFETKVDSLIAGSSSSTSLQSGIGYVGFVPQRANTTLTTSLEDDALAGLDRTLETPHATDIDTIDRSQAHDYAKLYVVAPDWDGLAGNTIECGLYNSSYTVDLDYRNGQQNISVKSLERVNGVTAEPAFEDCGGGACSVSVVAYISMMDAMGRLLLGHLKVSDVGSLIPTRTQISTTVLMQTAEMQRLHRRTIVAGNKFTPEPLSIANITMTDALEQLFLNFTLSLFSDSYLLQNQSSASEGMVLVRAPQNVYAYDSRNLFIAYGVGICVDLVVVVVGLLCVWTSSGSYMSAFSTILRTTRNPSLDTVIQHDDGSGTWPMSTRLAKLKVILQESPSRTELGKHTMFRLVNDWCDLEQDASSESPELPRPSLDSLLIRPVAGGEQKQANVRVIITPPTPEPQEDVIMETS